MTTKPPKKVRKPSDDESTALAAETPVTLAEMKERAVNVRSAAKLHYVTDPKERGVEWWWQNGEVSYTTSLGKRETVLFREHIQLDGFVRWSREEKWTMARDAFWSDVELSVLTNLRDETVKEKIDELRVMRQSRSYLTEYLFPLKDPKAPDGIKRWPADHKWAGLPVFPLDLGNMPKFIESYLKLDERVAVKRGDALMHTNSEIDDITGGTPESKEHPGKAIAKHKAKADDFSPSDVRAMAKAFLVQREESLKDVIDVEAVEDNDDEDETI